MKVDKNQQFNATIPIRLDIATKLLAGYMATMKGSFLITDGELNKVLETADRLIEKHNQTCEKEEQ